ncbi:right-handed parallel beta-helix repeat-containing protein, partial [Opitutales bacterium]|nr:right-handed parallel beta-helix repeat-containing protein [Opitutales bacterium]
VDKDAVGRGDGSSWQNAYTDLSVALLSKHSFTQVWVAEGVYLPGSTRAASFTLPFNTSVYGGFASGENFLAERNASANLTVLSGDIGVTNNGADNSFHVVVPSQNSVLDGFTIKDGNATYNFSNDDRGVGAGLYAKSSSFVISNCVFTNNQSYQRGGGVFIEDVNATFQNCTFSNHLSNTGGAIDINNSRITFISCEFTNNSSKFEGGAIYWTDSNGSMTDSNFTSNVNVASNGGGGIYMKNSSPSVTNCNFSFNLTYANNHGGAVKLVGSSPSFTNCSFVQNKSKINSGGAIYIDSTSIPTFSSNEFQFNSAESFGGAIFTEGVNLELNNSLFIGNYADLGGCVATQGNVAVSFANTRVLGNEANSSGSSSAGFIYLNSGVTSSLFVNCVFSGNKSHGRNGVYRPNGMSRFVNCTFSGNQALAEGGITLMFSGDSIDISNCILWDNSGGTVNDIYVNGGSATVNNSLFNPSHSDGTISGSNNINSNPLFTDFNGLDNILGTLDDNLVLQSTSPAIDVGSNSVSNYVNTDLNGRTRDGSPDLGAYEYSGNTAPSFTSISTLSVPENQMSVIDVNAFDSDGNSLTFSITGGNDPSKFQIDSQTGVLTFLTAPDYENPTDSDGNGEYRVIVSVSDSVDTVTQEIVVSVSDSVDALETFTVSGGQSFSPFFTITDPTGAVVDFSTYALQRGATYFFVASNISSSHPFMIGESIGNLSSSLVNGGPLTSSSHGQKITLVIPSEFAGQLFYFCTIHSGMNRFFVLSNQAP